jgi:hypothetical protein
LAPLKSVVKKILSEQTEENDKQVS